MRLLHLTDLHMTGFEQRPEGLYPRIPEHAWWAHTRRFDLMGYLVPRVLDQALAEFAPDFVLFGGDLVDDGFAEVGRSELLQVRDLVQQACGRALQSPTASGSGDPSHPCPAPVGWLYGNHDGPQGQFGELFGGLNWTRDVGGVRLVGLNSGSMEPEQEQDSSRVALAHLREALATNEAGLPVVVALHQWLWPPDVHGYSFARAEEALALIEDDPRVVAVISAHYHTGRHEERHGIHYCTGRAMAEPPFCYSTFDVGEGRLRWREFALKPGERRFLLTQEQDLPLRTAHL